MTIWLILPAIFCVLAGMPIAIALLTGSAAWLLVTGIAPLTIIPQRFFDGVDVFSLLAAPLFILAGELMNRSGITNNLIKLAEISVGRFRGGLAQVNILSSVFFSGLSGAAVADAAALGKILIPAMKKAGYSAEYSAAVTSASSIIGPIIPPSIAIIVYGGLLGVSVGALFAAAILPGLLLALGLMVLAYIIALIRKHPKREVSSTLPEFFDALRDATLALLLPIIIIGGIRIGAFTPTEAGGVAVVYTTLLGMLFYRTIGWRELMGALLVSARISASILVIIGAASVFSWCLSVEQVPDKLAEFVTNLTTNPLLFLLFVNVFLLLIGMILETTASIVMFAPLFYPVALSLGIDPVHFSIVVIVNLCIGLSTPPFAITLFVTCAIAGTRIERTIPSILPFNAVQIAVLMIITYFPAITLFLPHLLGMS